jgi:hypothetical protein
MATKATNTVLRLLSASKNKQLQHKKGKGKYITLKLKKHRKECIKNNFTIEYYDGNW